MLVTFWVGILSMFFGFLAWKLKNKNYIIFSFFVIFIYLALRYNFGSDYMSYYKMFNDIKDSSWSEVIILANTNNLGESLEFGYIYLNKFFSIFSGFFFFIGFQSLVLIIVYFKIIYRWVNVKYVWLSFFILIFSISLLVRSISGLRQGFAVFCFIFSIQYLIKRDFLKYLLCILLAASFHYSSIILLPLYLFFTPKKVSKEEPFIYFFLFLFILFFGGVLLQPIEGVVNSFLPKYSLYLDDIIVNPFDTGLGVLANSFLYFTILFNAKRTTPSDSVFYRIVAAFIILSALGGIIGQLGRLSLYCAPAFVVVVPNMMRMQFDKIHKAIFISLFIIFTLYLAYGHYTDPINLERNFYYKTILSSQEI